MNVRLVLLTVVLGSTPIAAALAEAPRATPAAVPQVKAPVTAADHDEMAREYEAKAEAWRKEAAYHRQMAAAYKREHPDRKSGAKDPWAEKMEKHCMTIVKDAEKLATDAEYAAKYHHQRALELTGK